MPTYDSALLFATLTMISDSIKDTPQNTADAADTQQLRQHL